METKPLNQLHTAALFAMAIVAGVLLAFQFVSKTRDNERWSGKWEVSNYGWPFSSVSHWQNGYYLYSPKQLSAYPSPPVPLGERLWEMAKQTLELCVVLLECGILWWMLLILVAGRAVDRRIRTLVPKRRFPSTVILGLLTLVAVTLFNLNAFRVIEFYELDSGRALAIDLLFCSMLVVSTGLIVDAAVRGVRGERPIRVTHLLKMTTVVALTFAYWQHVNDLNTSLRMPRVGAGLMLEGELLLPYPAHAIYILAVAATITVVLNFAIKLIRYFVGREIARFRSVFRPAEA